MLAGRRYQIDPLSAEPGSPHPGLVGCMELKTNMLIRNERQQKTFERCDTSQAGMRWFVTDDPKEVTQALGSVMAAGRASVFRYATCSIRRADRVRS